MAILTNKFIDIVYFLFNSYNPSNKFSFIKNERVTLTVSSLLYIFISFVFSKFSIAAFTNLLNVEFFISS